MRNAQVAEWILSLVTSPDRAASTVGDLMENAAHRGALWFWTGVLRTAFSMMWRDVTANPGRMVRLAGGAFLLGLALTFVGFLVIIPLTMVLSSAGVQDGKVYSSWPFTVASVLVAMILVPLQQGRWLARRAPGHELVPCLALAIISAVLTVITTAFGFGTVWQVVLSVALSPIPIFAGAVWVRRKRLSH